MCVCVVASLQNPSQHNCMMYSPILLSWQAKNVNTARHMEQAKLHGWSEQPHPSLEGCQKDTVRTMATTNEHRTDVQNPTFRPQNPGKHQALARTASPLPPLQPLATRQRRLDALHDVQKAAGVGVRRIVLLSKSLEVASSGFEVWSCGVGGLEVCSFGGLEGSSLGLD